MYALFLYYATLWSPVGHLIVFLGMIFEGEVVLLATAFLTHQGVFRLIPILMTVFSGVLVGDFLWYQVGATFVRPDSRLARWTEHLVKVFDERLKTKPFLTILGTKFAYGIHHAVLLRAGMLKVDARKFLEIDVVASSIWIAVIWGLGFFAGESFNHIHHSIRFAELFVLGGIIVFVFLEKVASWISRWILSRRQKL